MRVAFGRGALPNALILGAAKGGTTSVYRWLCQHPDVCGSRVKELRFFNDHLGKGAHWYAAHFAVRAGQSVRIEASPSYLWDPHVPERVRALLHTPKLIVLLREPVQRAWSQYWMSVRLGLETASFRDALSRERMRFGDAGQFPADGSMPTIRYSRESYLGKGMYAPQIERWLSVFPRSCFLFIRSEDLFRSPGPVLSQLFDFLDLEPLETAALQPHNVGRYPPLDPGLRAELETRFVESNARVEQLTGIRWP